AYLKTNTYEELKNIDYKFSKNSKLYNFTLKNIKANTHGDKICFELLENSKNQSRECYNFSTIELIDFITDETTFLNDCKKSSTKLTQLIYQDFPDIDSLDSNFYKHLMEYLTEKKESLIGNLCLMCGKTKLTEEIMEVRISELN